MLQREWYQAGSLLAMGYTRIAFRPKGKMREPLSRGVKFWRPIIPMRAAANQIMLRINQLAQESQHRAPALRPHSTGALKPA